MPILLTFVYFAIFMIVVQLLSKREGYYSTLTVFGISCFLYYVGIPFDLFLHAIETLDKSSLQLTVASSLGIRIIVMGTIAFLSFSLGYYLSSFRTVRFGRDLGRYCCRIPYSLRIIFVAPLIGVLLFFRSEAVSVSTYDEASFVHYNKPLFMLLCWYVTLYGSVIGGTLMIRRSRKRKILGILLIFAIMVWGIYSSDKNVILAAALSVAASQFRFPKAKNILSFLVIILGVAIFLYLSKVFSLYRGGLDLSSAFSKSVEQYGVRFADPLGPFISLEHVVNTTTDFRYGDTYLQIFYLIVPRALWKDRPLDLSDQFALDNIPEWSPGLGMGYSLLAEAYLNFSWMGPLVQYLLLGFLWGHFWKLMRRILWHFPKDLWQGFYYIYGYYLLILMHRGTIAGLLKMIIQTFAVLLVFVVIVDFNIEGLRKSIMSKRAQGT